MFRVLSYRDPMAQKKGQCTNAANSDLQMRCEDMHDGHIKYWQILHMTTHNEAAPPKMTSMQASKIAQPCGREPTSSLTGLVIVSQFSGYGPWREESKHHQSEMNAMLLWPTSVPRGEAKADIPQRKRGESIWQSQLISSRRHFPAGQC